jgi:hypothetical protein
MGVSEMAPRGKPKLCEVSVSVLREELSKVVGSIWPGMHKGAECNGFRGNAGKDIKGMSGNNVREVGDYSNAVPGIGSLIGRSVNGWHGMRKSRGRVRT